MKTSIKRTILLLISVWIFSVLFSFVAIKDTAKAEGEPRTSAKYTFADGEFAMANGAAVRIAPDANGLRFLAGFKAGFDFKNVSEFGMLIGPADLVGDSLEMEDVKLGNAVNISYTAADIETYLFNVTGTNGATYHMFGGSLTDIYVNNYNRDFMAIAYYYDKGGVLTYAKVNEGENVRSLSTVASNFMEDDASFAPHDDTVKALVESYANKYQVQNGSFLYGMNGWKAVSEDAEGAELGFVVDRENHYPEAEYGYMCADYGTASEKVFSFARTDTIKEDGATHQDREINHERVHGTLTSSLFVVKEGAWLTFSWGGGGNGDVLLKICKEDGTVEAAYDNIYNNAGSLQAKTLKRAVDLGGLGLAGETVYLVFEDNSISNYGGIVVSDIVTDATECPADAMEIAKHGSYILNAGFEDGNLNGWTYQKGTDDGQINGESAVISATTWWGERLPYNQSGNFHFDGWEANVTESNTYWLRSSEFVLGGSGVISFKMGGNAACVKVFKADGTQIAEYNNTQFRDVAFPNLDEGCRLATMTTFVADLSNHIGEKLYIELHDKSVTGWAVAFFDEIVTYYADKPVVAEMFDTVQFYKKIDGVQEETPRDFMIPWVEAVNEYSI